MNNPAISAVYLHPNPQRDEELRITQQTAALLHEMGCELYTSAPETGRLAAYVRYIPPDQISGRVQCILTLGGDGTILHMARTAAQARIPILGVNLGKMGFMASLEAHELPLLSQLSRGEYALDARMMIQIVLRRENGETAFSDTALNDAVVNAPEARMAALSVLADGAVMADYAGDGVVVATPTGSTAYSMSAGGPIVDPAAESLIVTPICAHAFYARSFVLGADRRVTIQPRKKAGLVVDGSKSRTVYPGDEVTVCRSPMRCELIRLKSGSFYDTLSEKIKK